jgi:hypothetical protein
VSPSQTRLLCSAVILLCAVNVSGKDVKQARSGSAQFVGAVGCRSSSCHGGAGEKRSQYVTWSRQDFHSRAYAILLDARSARIAEAVGITEAQSSARCTVCHSPFQSVSQTQLGPKAHPDEGVSCENCHGAAGSWLRGHTRSDWTYATRVSAGMHDLRDLYTRATTCVACHQNIDNTLLKAGHPALFFELDSQSINEPKHWRDDDKWIGPRSWLVGQAVALREATWRLLQHGRDDRAALERWDGLAWLLTKALTEHADLPLTPNLEVPFTNTDLTETQKHADALALKSATLNWDENVIRKMLADLVSDDGEFANRRIGVSVLTQRAMRLVLALDRLTAAINANRSEPLKVETELNALREDVKRHYDFDVAAFAEHLRRFRNKL